MKLIDHLEAAKGEQVSMLIDGTRVVGTLAWVDRDGGTLMVRDNDGEVIARIDRIVALATLRNKDD